MYYQKQIFDEYFDKYFLNLHQIYTLNIHQCMFI